MLLKKIGIIICVLIFFISCLDNNEEPDPDPSIVAQPTFLPAGGTYTTAQSVVITTTTADATISWSTNDGITWYTGTNVSISKTTTILAKASLVTGEESQESSAVYTIPTVSSIYVVGTEKNAGGKLVAKYWKDGIVHSISTDGTKDAEATAIKIVGNDVYITGHTRRENYTNTIFIWKNGNLSLIPNVKKCEFANGLFIDGNDVYICGYEIDPDNNNRESAKYWKNGVPVVLGDGLTNTRATDIYVSDGKVYVSGYATFGMYYNTLPLIWVDGLKNVLQTTSPSYSDGHVNSVIVTNNNVYLAGFQIRGYNNLTTQCWMNDSIIFESTNQNAWAFDMCFSGTNIYMAGHAFDPNGVHTGGYYWRNGKPYKLTSNLDIYKSEEVYAIASFNEQVYACGVEFNTSSYNGHFIKCWFNGVTNSLTDGTYYARPYGIALKVQ